MEKDIFKLLNKLRHDFICHQALSVSLEYSHSKRGRKSFAISILLHPDSLLNDDIDLVDLAVEINSNDSLTLFVCDSTGTLYFDDMILNSIEDLSKELDAMPILLTNVCKSLTNQNFLNSNNNSQISTAETYSQQEPFFNYFVDFYSSLLNLKLTTSVSCFEDLAFYLTVRETSMCASMHFSYDLELDYTKDFTIHVLFSEKSRYSVILKRRKTIQDWLVELEYTNLDSLYSVDRCLHRVIEDILKT